MKKKITKTRDLTAVVPMFLGIVTALSLSKSGASGFWSLVGGLTIGVIADSELRDGGELTVTTTEELISE